mmetsp:Transcript_37128/g.116840  ORF Transcript_37128/g.116840 Transcript_37128/m.116840 type:complete len:84 (-) Transcript_37128:7-258(-)
MGRTAERIINADSISYHFSEAVHRFHTNTELSISSNLELKEVSRARGARRYEEMGEERIWKRRGEGRGGEERRGEEKGAGERD